MIEIYSWLVAPLYFTPCRGAYCLQCFHTVGYERQEQHPVCNNSAIRCWPVICLERAADLPADATAIPKRHRLLPHLNPDWFYLSGTGLPRLSGKRGR